MPDNASAKALWSEFVATSGVTAPYDSFAFGGPHTPDLANTLAQLVCAGRKRASSGLLDEYEEEGEALPAVGDYAVVLDAGGTAQCVIRTTAVSIVRFADVDASFAFEEGEGDRTLAAWRVAHRAFFLGVGRTLEDDSKMVCERFEKVWP